MKGVTEYTTVFQSLCQVDLNYSNFSNEFALREFDSISVAAK